jgi:hypothetical protein
MISADSQYGRIFCLPLAGKKPGYPLQVLSGAPLAGFPLLSLARPGGLSLSAPSAKSAL